jgi:hypothetical protein
MPYKIVKNHESCPDSKPWAVVNKDTGAKVGCHNTETSAKKQLAALYANVPDAKK